MNPPTGFDFVESSVFRGPQKLVAQIIVSKVAISFMCPIAIMFINLAGASAFGHS